MTRLHSRSVARLEGRVAVPGDKSISHRALMLAALATGESRIAGLLESEDVMATAAALRAMGVEIEKRGEDAWRVHGVGVGGLASPADVIDCGNSGTTARLLMGLLASQPLHAVLSGDASLRRRPMGRVMRPLAEFGAVFEARDGEYLPLLVRGTAAPLAVDYRLPVASAQVKSAILLAALNTPGTTMVREPVPARDHSERMLAAAGAAIDVATEDGERLIRVSGERELAPLDLGVPGDISSAAFPIVAALLAPAGHVRIVDVGVNPTRTGLLDALAAMGAEIVVSNRREAGGEPVADLEIAGGQALHGTDFDPALAPRMIDEYPVLFVAAACAEGASRFSGLSELRVKESDRIATMAAGLAAAGVRVEEQADGLVIEGCGGPVPGGARVATRLDHRIAMAFLVLGLCAREPVAIDDARPIATSFPGFVALMNRLGARIAAH
ncbi:MAG: 3-phosphoshikimate 1-carboxyvinyltransferase [Alphaproteobacteria bacterium]|nr:MAG: 3-phosphoshikimate 1-carboxyvinyltransferase [Alphaproteobacteria bacterium]